MNDNIWDNKNELNGLEMIYNKYINRNENKIEIPEYIQILTKLDELSTEYYEV